MKRTAKQLIFLVTEQPLRGGVQAPHITGPAQEAGAFRECVEKRSEPYSFSQAAPPRFVVRRFDERALSSYCQCGSSGVRRRPVDDLMQDTKRRRPDLFSSPRSVLLVDVMEPTNRRAGVAQLIRIMRYCSREGSDFHFCRDLSAQPFSVAAPQASTKASSSSTSAA